MRVVYICIAIIGALVALIILCNYVNMAFCGADFLDGIFGCFECNTICIIFVGVIGIIIFGIFFRFASDRHKGR